MMTQLNLVVLVTATLFIAIIIPLLLLIDYLWKVRKINGATQKFRRVMFTLAFGKLFYFLMEILSAIMILRNGPEVPVSLILPILVGSLVLAVINWYALIAVRRISFK